MKQVSGKQLCLIAEKLGWELKRIQGSHHIYAKKGRVERLSIPVHANNPLKSGLLNHLLKIMDITEQDL